MKPSLFSCFSNLSFVLVLKVAFYNMLFTAKICAYSKFQIFCLMSLRMVRHSDIRSWLEAWRLGNWVADSEVADTTWPSRAGEYMILNTFWRHLGVGESLSPPWPAGFDTFAFQNCYPNLIHAWDNQRSDNHVQTANFNLVAHHVDKVSVTEGDGAKLVTSAEDNRTRGFIIMWLYWIRCHHISRLHQSPLDFLWCDNMVGQHVV